MKILLFALLTASLGFAADVESLLPELQGKEAAQPRDAAAWRALHVELLDYYLPKISVAEIQERGGPAKEYQSICWRAARPGAEVERQATAEAIAAKLGDDMPKPARLWLVKILQHVGGAECVPALVKLADSDDGEIRTWALRALAENPSPDSDAVFGELIANAPADRLVERICAAPAAEALVPVLAKLANGTGDVPSAAIRALGRTGSKTGADALWKLTVTEQTGFARDLALLNCADRLAANGMAAAATDTYRRLFGDDHAETVRCGALRGLLATDGGKAIALVGPVLGTGSARMQGVAADYLRQTASEDVVLAYAEALPTFSTAGQVLLLDVFAARRATALCGAVVQAVGSKDEPVRVAAVQALAAVGDGECVPLLLDLAAGTDAVGKEAATTVQRLAAPGVDEALLAAAEKGDVARRTLCVDLLVARRSGVAVSALLTFARADDRKLAGNACKGLGLLAPPESLPQLVALVVSLDSKSARRDAAKATLAVARRCPPGDERTVALLAALPNANEDGQVEILGILGELGGDAAFGAVRENMTSASGKLREAALRALCAWPDATPADVLLAVAQKDSDAMRQVLALRGCVRAYGLPGAPSPATVVERLQAAMAACHRDDERKVVIAGLGSVRHAAALTALQPHLDNAALKADAAAAMLRVATAVSREDRATANEYLALVVQNTEPGPLRDQAEETKRKIEEFDGFVVNWLVAGPFFKTKEACALLDMHIGPEGKDAATVQWRSVPLTGDPAKDWQVDLMKVVGGSNRAAYMVTWIRCGTALPGRFEIGSDDGVKVWLDDTVIHRNDAARPVKRGEDVVDVLLTPGWHRVMMKITQGGGGWGGCLRICGTDGSSLPGWQTLADWQDLTMLESDLATPALAESARRALAEIQTMLAGKN
jgi:HEAT repeat protein